MKLTLKKQLLVLMMLVVFVPSSYADDGDNHSNGMETMMVVMMGGMMLWMVYRLATGNSGYANLEEFQKEVSPVALASAPPLFTAQAEALSPKKNLDVLLFNYNF